MKIGLIVIGLFLGLLAEIPAYGSMHAWSGSPSGRFWNNWALTINGGATSYFGDLSLYDERLGDKLRYESKPAFGFLLTKYLSDELGLSGQFIYGGLQGDNGQGLSFNTNFVEYNVQLRLDLLNLILPKNNTGLGVNLFGGIGHFVFQTEKYIVQGSEIQTQAHRVQAPEFVYFGGAGIEYILAERFNISLDAGVRQLQNDRLDNEIVNGDFDYYSYVSVGITYFFGRNFNYPKRPNTSRRGVKMAFK